MGHVTNLIAEKSGQPNWVVDSVELICGNGYSNETVSAGWAADPVHTNRHIYAKAALNLMEKMALNNQPSAGPVFQLAESAPALVVLNKKVMTFGKKSNLKLGLIQTRQLHYSKF
jgi:hypothetical protein